MSGVEIVPYGVWVYFLSEKHKVIDESKCGKWMYFFKDREFATELCQKAVNNDICTLAKHSDDESGVCCFYIDGEDISAHKRVIQFFLDNNLIKRTKTGRLYNISFKFDNQTRSGEYGNDFKGIIKLEDFLDLYTGEWKS